MKKFDIEGVAEICEAIQAIDRNEAFKKIIARYPSSYIRIDSIGKWEIMGICENCGMPVFEDQKYSWGDEWNDHWHTELKDCPKLRDGKSK